MRATVSTPVMALAVLVGLLWSGVIPATMPWTASMFGLVLLVFLTEFLEVVAENKRRLNG